MQLTKNILSNLHCSKFLIAFTAYVIGFNLVITSSHTGIFVFGNIALLVNINGSVIKLTKEYIALCVLKIMDKINETPVIVIQNMPAISIDTIIGKIPLLYSTPINTEIKTNTKSCNNV